MKLTAELVYGFSQAFLQERYDEPKPTPAFHIDLWRLCCSDDKHVAAAAPRGHAKSTSVTHAFGLAALLFGWKSHLLIVSGTEGQASGFLKNMTVELTSNDKLIEAFDIKLPLEKETATEIIVRMGKDGRKFRVIAKGSEQAMRGMLWMNKRPDLVIGDDLETDDIVMNKERRAKFKDWFLAVLYPAVSRSGYYRIVGTILHMDALLEEFMPVKTEDYPLIKTPIAEYTENPEQPWKAVRYRAHNPDFSTILWPEQFTKKDLIGLKEMYTRMGRPDKYAQEYLNYPIDESTAYLRKEDLLEMDDIDKEKPMKYYVGADFALSKESRADYTVFVIAGIDSEGIMHVVDVRRARWDTYEIVEEMFSIQSRYHPEVFFVEKGTIWLAVESHLRKEMYKPNRTTHGIINYDPVPASTDKMIRARPLQARTRAGAVRFNKEAAWYEELELEMLRFPRAAHDDQVDALSHLCQQIIKLQHAPTTEEQMEQEYQRQLKTTRLMTGRTSIGGY